MFNFGSLIGMLGNIKPEDLQAFLAHNGQGGAPVSNPAIPTPRPSPSSPSAVAPQAAPVAAPSASQAPAPSGGPMAALRGLLDFGERGSDRRSDLSQGLLAFGSNMAQAGAPSFDPSAGSFGAAFGKGAGAFGEAMNSAQDARAKRTFMQGQTAAQERNADPSYLAQRALAGQGIVQGENGNYQYAPGYGDMLAEQRRQETLAATQATAATNLENDRRALRDHELQVERGQIDASRTAENRPLNSTQIRQLEDADESLRTGEALIRSIDEALVLNEERYYGPGAGARAGISRVLGDSFVSDESRGVATTTYNNLISNQVIAQLKSTFGGAITEGERNYMADNIVAAIDKSPQEAAAILTRLRQETEIANGYQRDKLDGIESGTRYRPNSMLEGYDARTVAPAAGAVAQPAASSDGIPSITGPQDPAYAALPNGAQFRLPNGRVMIKR